jgi:hypothetical protein
MSAKYLTIVLLILLVPISGCIQSDINNVEQLIPQINDHLHKGDVYYNQSATDLNSFEINSALQNADSAYSEFSLARSSTSQALSYAQNSNDSVFIKYLQLALSEIDAKLNATTDLKTAAQLFQTGNNTTANIKVRSANAQMQNALDFQALREQLVSQNPSKFKTS